MKNFWKVTPILIVAALLAACTIPSTAPQATQPPAPAMQTAAALTVQAVLNATPLPTATLEVSATPVVVTATGTSSTTATATTPTAGSAKLTVEDVTNCRSGPGMGYERVTQIAAGQEVPILGSLPTYWLVQTDAGVCWVAREFATPSGDIAAVPTVTAPPTPQGAALVAPGIDRWTYACTGTGHADVTIRWIDRSTNEAGYRIYMNGQVLVELPAETTEWANSVLLPAGQTATMYVEAFNATGAASSTVFSFTC